MIHLTTQSDEAPAGVLKETLDTFRDVRDGKIKDPKKLGALYEFPAAMIEAQAYLDPANFYVTNPSTRPAVITTGLAGPQARGGEEGRRRRRLNIFLAKHLNIQIGTTSVPTGGLRRVLEAGRRCVAHLELNPRPLRGDHSRRLRRRPG